MTNTYDEKMNTYVKNEMGNVFPQIHTHILAHPFEEAKRAIPPLSFSPYKNPLTLN